MTTQLATPGPLYGWAQPTVAADWTADMLERLADDGWLYELVEGRVVRMPPPGPDHGHTEWSIAHPLGAYVEAHGLGAIYVGEAGWDLTRSGERKDTVLASDVAVVRAERLPLPAPRRGKTYRPLAPDLVVEIASPTQYRPDLADKAQHWLDRGVRLVWVIWPDRRELDVWTPGVVEPRVLREDDILDGSDVVPGFHILLSQFL
ncbi:MAG TPA: Uma2 family endonuclease [Chloroflexota bacterium]|jgi:Uma2 family endonuclease|nr:Uma2 family endonuclease [Chloroflexota bacterium]